MNSKKIKDSWLRGNVIRMAHVHYAFVVVFLFQTIIYDAWHIVAPNAVLYRWILTAALAVITTFVWYMAKNVVHQTTVFKLLVWLLILADITAASMNVYSQRGMASRAVMLYTIPIAVSATLISRSALFATAALSVAAYTSTAVAYFVLNFNEGYKVELYGETAFYSLMFFVVAALIWIAIRSKRSKPAQ